MKIVTIVGTRPNFVKVAPLIEEIKKYNNIDHTLVHTGQHYSKNLSKLFFDELSIPKPEITLNIGSGSPGEQIGNIIIKLEKVLIEKEPDLVIVVGDVNSTLAGAITAKHLGMKVAHIEAGLRSFDLNMPEEINRMLVDRISDLLFTTEDSANENLLREGVKSKKIFFVGNLMIDNLLKHKEESEKTRILEDLKLNKKNYVVLTVHRPSNVDNKNNLENVISIIKEIQNHIPLVFPMHPRTKKNFEHFQLEKEIKKMNNLKIIEPLGYLEFLNLMSNSKFVLTDSGGIQEETSILKIPCITLRENTERPITLTKGTNLLKSTNKEKVIEKSLEIINNKILLNKENIPLWDGKAAKRIVRIIIDELSS